MTPNDPSVLADRIRGGDRRALARGITLVESTRADHRAAADALLDALMPATGGSLRLGISGAPGVGKSTFIEAFGMAVIGLGHKVAVLAVDPSSRRSGGSILGDKTRMEELSRAPDAYIRPSPAGATLGGVARRTRESMLLCEAAGFDVIVVETVGVGQSETAVADMVDLFMLLLLPSGGDELQGIKRGIVELADLVVVNKADGEMETTARRTAAEYQNALHLLRPAHPDWTPKVLTCSALKGIGLDALWATVCRFRASLDGRAPKLSEADAVEDPSSLMRAPITPPAGPMANKRQAQARAWMWSEVTETLDSRLRGTAEVRAVLPEIEASVADGTLPAGRAARRLLEAFLGPEPKPEQRDR